MREITKAKRINDSINDQITYKGERRPRDHWQKPEETMELGTGDCEDFAILKMHLLLEAGFSEKNVWVERVYIDDEHGTDGHMVCVLKKWNGEFVLDNIYPKVVRWFMTGYRRAGKKSNRWHKEKLWDRLNSQSDPLHI